MNEKTAMTVKIVPSLLAADISCLHDEIARAEGGGCDAFHLDIMDWHFVPNLSFGPRMVETLRRLTDLPIDVHLMVDNPLEMIGSFATAGSDYITIHVETVNDITDALGIISGYGVHPGITFRPDTPVEKVIGYLDRVDLVLVMSVYPGFGGQTFIDTSYERLKKVAEQASVVNPSLILSVDGGVNMENAPLLVKAGANYLVAGTSIFKDHNAEKNIRLMREAAGSDRL